MSASNVWRGVKGVIYLALVATAISMGATEKARAFGPFNCCGDGSCTLLNSSNSCPQGGGQCNAPLTNCCSNACNQV